MERIEINGVWYVREDLQTPKTLTIEKNDITHFTGIIYENDNYCFEASKIYEDFELGQEYNDITIKITFKEKGVSANNWNVEYWDSKSFLQGVLENHPSSINSLRDEFNEDEEGVKIFKAFLVYLQEISWL